MQPVKVVLFGLGVMGMNHLRVLSILKDVDLLGVFDLDFARAQKSAAAHRIKAFATREDALAAKPDAVVICTPTSTHADYINFAAGSVKNIFVEKPMGVSPEEAQAVCALKESKGLNIQVGFIERFNPVVQQLRNVLQSSGKIINVDFVRTNKISARIQDVDVIADLMIHDIDLALYLNGPVKSLSANGTVQDNLVDFASAVIVHENGSFSRILASRITEKKIRKIEATCSDLFVDCELFKKELIINRQSEIHQKPGEPFRISSSQESIEVKQQEALLMELQTFIASCSGVRDVMAPSEQDALAALELCHQIQSRIYEQCVQK